ncbi:hypothetical protein BDK51DRAFT_29393, partial [Blyttiomyces helicus]
MSSKRKLTTAAPANDDWKAPSAFGKLVKSLKRSSTAKKVVGKPTLRDALEPQAAPPKKKKKTKAAPIVEEEADEEGFSGEDEDLESGEEEDQLSDDEEDADDEEDVLDEDEDDETDGMLQTDPFERHFGDHVSDVLVFKAAAVDSREWEVTATEDPVLHSMLKSTLRGQEDDGSSVAKTGRTKVEDYSVKKRLVEPWISLNSSVSQSQKTEFTDGANLTPLQSRLLDVMNSYSDLFYSNQTHENSKAIRHIYALHAMDHVFKTRDRVLKNSAKLKGDAADNDKEP